MFSYTSLRIVSLVIIKHSASCHISLHILLAVVAYLLNIRNIELKISKHIRRTYLRSVAPEVEDTVLIWMLTSAKKQNVPVNAKMLS